MIAGFVRKKNEITQCHQVKIEFEGFLIWNAIVGELG